MPDDSPTVDPESASAAAAFGLPVPALIDLLEGGDMEIEGRMPYSSNATLLVTMADLEDAGVQHKAIYKPHRGERPLWDFPDGLYKREVAMYRLSDALGFTVIPPTVIVNGQLGEGSLQAFVDADFQHHYFTLLEEGIAVDDLMKLCVLDLIANNTDRKSGHCLLGPDGHAYGIDHGLAFHQEWKLRTVMWDFVGEAIPDDILEAVDEFVTQGPPVELCALLNTFEVDAVVTRAKAIVREGEFPDDDTGGHRYPWPLV